MSIKLLLNTLPYVGEESTYPSELLWHWSDGAEEQRLSSFRAYAPGYIALLRAIDSYDARLDEHLHDPTSCALFWTKKKKTLLIRPCPDDKDERILLISWRWPSLGYIFSLQHPRIRAESSRVHTSVGYVADKVLTKHVIVGLLHPSGYVHAKRPMSNEIEVFSWDGYQTMSWQDFEIWRRERAAKLALPEREARDADKPAHTVALSSIEEQSPEVEPLPSFASRLAHLNTLLTAMGEEAITVKKESFIFQFVEYNYSEDNVSAAEMQVEVMGRRAERRRIKGECKALQPRAEAVGIELELDDAGVIVRRDDRATAPLPYDKGTLLQLGELISKLEQLVTEEQSEESR